MSSMDRHCFVLSGNLQAYLFPFASIEFQGLKLKVGLACVAVLLNSNFTGPVSEELEIFLSVVKDRPCTRSIIIVEQQFLSIEHLHMTSAQ